LTIEKALYEILYELSNRPTWVGIPLTAFNRLLGATVFQRVDRTA
jgi:predicted trehalose synthase